MEIEANNENRAMKVKMTNPQKVIEEEKNNQTIAVESHTISDKIQKSHYNC